MKKYFLLTTLFSTLFITSAQATSYDCEAIVSTESRLLYLDFIHEMLTINSKIKVSHVGGGHVANFTRSTGALINLAHGDTAYDAYLRIMQGSHFIPGIRRNVGYYCMQNGYFNSNTPTLTNNSLFCKDGIRITDIPGSIPLFPEPVIVNCQQ